MSSPLAAHYPTLCALAVDLRRFIDEPPPPVGPPESRVRLDGGRDLLCVRWPGLPGKFWLTGPQRRVVHELLEAKLESRVPDVDQGVLLRAAGVPGARRLADVFRGSAAWGVLVVPGRDAGTYRLPELPPVPDDAA